MWHSGNKYVSLLSLPLSLLCAVDSHYSGVLVGDHAAGTLHDKLSFIRDSRSGDLTRVITKMGHCEAISNNPLIKAFMDMIAKR